LSVYFLWRKCKKFGNYKLMAADQRREKLLAKGRVVSRRIRAVIL